MDGYSLTAKMKKLRRRFRLTATEQALYHELVGICNEDGWEDTFSASNEELFLALRISEKTLDKARQNLINTKLIYYKSGKSKRQVGLYSFTQPFKEKTPPTVVNITTNGITNTTTNSSTNSSDLYKTKTETKKKENIKEKFEEFRKTYPGTKRGLNTEFENFKKKNKDYEILIDKLLPAIKKLIEWKKEKTALNQFVPEYANLQTWINQRRWEVELEKIENENAYEKEYSAIGSGISFR